MAACSLGKCPLARVARRNRALSDSMAFESGMTSLTPLAWCWVGFYDLVVGFGASRRNEPGQAVVFGDLRGRVGTWPPQRLTRLRCERESVSVVFRPVSSSNPDVRGEVL